MRRTASVLIAVAAGLHLASAGHAQPGKAPDQLPWQPGSSAPGAGVPASAAAAAPEAAAPAAKPAAKKRVRAAGPPARVLFGAAREAAPLAARAIGTYAKGCLAGAQALAIDGPAWQAMRLSRNRNWGHPEVIRLVERLAIDAKAHDGWPGLLVGDISQPRGGPMLTGHASHQIGLDADIWLTPMPNRRLSEREREELSATDMVAPDKVSVNPAVWTEGHVRLIRRAASYPEVERVLVNPAIKRALCEGAGNDREFLRKVRPIWGHTFHMHIRIACPAGSETCQKQVPPPSNGGDPYGCGKELQGWLKLVSRPPKPVPPGTPPPESKPQITLADLPQECRIVLNTGAQAPAPPAAAAVAPVAPVAPASPAAGATK